MVQQGVRELVLVMERSWNACGRIFDALAE